MSRILQLCDDELDVLTQAVTDPLEPRRLVALSSTAQGLRARLQAALAELRKQHEEAKYLLAHTNSHLQLQLNQHDQKDCESLSRANHLGWNRMALTPALVSTMAMLLRTNGLKPLTALYLLGNGIDATGMKQLCAGLDDGALSSLLTLGLSENAIGPTGAEALAVAVRGGALPKLQALSLGSNGIGNRGAAALASLRKHPALQILTIDSCNIGDEGMAALFTNNLAKGDFRSLKQLHLNDNQISTSGCVALASLLDSGALPKLAHCYADDAAPVQALERRRRRKLFIPHGVPHTGVIGW